MGQGSNGEGTAHRGNLSPAHGASGCPRVSGMVTVDGSRAPARVGLSAASALLFFPTALVALAYSLVAARAVDPLTADRAAARAQVWRRITVVLGVLVYLVAVITLLALGAFSSTG